MLLTRQRQVLGDDHRDTLRSPHNLAAVVAQFQSARSARQLEE
jgi:hypothetical protein